MHSTCLRRIHGRKLGSILPFMKGQNAAKNYTEKNGQHFVLFPIHKIYPQKLQPIEPELRNPTRRPFRSSTAITATLSASLAPPPDICLRSMGRCTLLLCPSPGSLRDLRVWGLRGRWKHYTDLSSRDWRNAPKRQTGFELDRRPQHLCDSTVAPPLPFPVHALWICGRKWGGENGPAEHCIKGALRDTRSSPKT